MTLEYSVIIDNFHFLRPGWLGLLVPLLAIIWLHRRQHSVYHRWQQYIAPHLLAHLVVESEDKQAVLPQVASLGMTVLFIVALAGPSWQKEASPFSRDDAAMVVALSLSESMLVDDVQPTRLSLAQLKVSDLLAGRQGSATALVVFAGTAHTVLPLTEDAEVLEFYLQDLRPDVLPEPGLDSLGALEKAFSLLDSRQAPGSVLVVSDGIDTAQQQQLTAVIKSARHQVGWLLVGTEEGYVTDQAAINIDELERPVAVDYPALEAFGSQSGADIQPFTIDSSDIDRIASRARSFEAANQASDDSQQWQDAGYFLVWPGALLCLLWFRRGMVMQWD